MIKRCIKCGYWWTTEDGKTNVCQECGENHSIANYSESELVEVLNKCYLIEPYNKLPPFCVKNGRGEMMYFGDKKECKRFIKENEIIYANMKLEKMK